MNGSKKKPHSPKLSPSAIDLDQLERLLDFMSEHRLEELDYAHGDVHIRLKKEATSGASPNLALPAVSTSVPRESQHTVMPVVDTAPVEAHHIIKSPIVGTFYAGSSPGAAPFVRIGDHVKNGQTLCIIEAMKLMNEIEADASGEVIEILVENGQSVEYGKPLFALRTANKKH